jgi:N-acetylneuraminate synthase
VQNIFVIAEAGVNHNGIYENAIKLVDEAKNAGADAVKFQTFITENCLSKSISKADYQINSTGAGSQYEMVKSLELTFEEHKKLKEYCDLVKIDYLSTAFDFESLDFLTLDLKLNKLKIASGEITNSPLLLAHAKTGCELILSTGMCTLGDIENALGVIAFGLINDTSKLPSKTEFSKAYFSNIGQELLKDKVTILHCTTEYPAPFDEINLNAIETIQKAFGIRIGYSDHSEGITVPILSVAYNVTIIEKHFTLDKNMEGPDHLASLEPAELRMMIQSVRQAEKALGSSSKRPSESEMRNLGMVRKVILAKQAIMEGDVFTSDNLCIKRGEGAVEPSEYWALLGLNANKNYEVDDSIDCKTSVGKLL